MVSALVVITVSLVCTHLAAAVTGFLVYSMYRLVSKQQRLHAWLFSISAFMCTASFATCMLLIFSDATAKHCRVDEDHIVGTGFESLAVLVGACGGIFIFFLFFSIIFGKLATDTPPSPTVQPQQTARSSKWDTRLFHPPEYFSDSSSTYADPTIIIDDNGEVVSHNPQLRF